jgi:starvation-inducible DNA-binding protein
MGMNTTRISLSQEIRTSVATMLAKSLAEAVDLERQAKQAHWNVRGMHFQQLHELFDKVAEEAREFGDMLAERAATLGALPDATVGSVAQWSELKGYPTGKVAAAAHVRAVADAMAGFANRTRAFIVHSDEAGDKVTSDLFTEITRRADQYLWFVESHVE